MDGCVTGFRYLCIAIIDNLFVMKSRWLLSVAFGAYAVHFC